MVLCIADRETDLLDLQMACNLFQMTGSGQQSDVFSGLYTPV